MRVIGRPANAQTVRDQIECRYSESEIRDMYAKHLAGRGKYTNLKDIGSQYIRRAHFETDYKDVIKTLEKDWLQFRKKDAHF